MFYFRHKFLLLLWKSTKMFHILSLFLLSIQGNQDFQGGHHNFWSTRHCHFCSELRPEVFGHLQPMHCFWLCPQFCFSDEFESNSSKYRTSKRIRKAFRSLGYGDRKFHGHKTFQSTWFGDLWLCWTINFLWKLFGPKFLGLNEVNLDQMRSNGLS